MFESNALALILLLENHYIDSHGTVHLNNDSQYVEKSI